MSLPQTAGIKRPAEMDTEATRRMIANPAMAAAARMAAGQERKPRAPLPPPHVLEALVPDSPAFTELVRMEAKLDWTLLRKKAEINDALGRSSRIKRALRVFVSNTAHDQAWQEGGKEVDTDSGAGVAGWVLRIEGRMLDTGNNRLDKTKRKLSTFLRSLVVEFDHRESPTFPEGNVVEWHPRADQAPLDAFEVLRRGDTNVKCRIVMHIAHSPERYKVLAPLSELISVREGSRAEIMAAVWQFIKAAGAQDKEDSTMVRPVGGLEKVFPHGSEGVQFHQIPELVTRCLAHPDPVVIPYTIRVDKEANVSPQCFDIPIEIEDPLKSRMAQIVQQFEGPTGSEIVALENKVGELAYFARDLKQKRDFLESFAASPHAFIHNWLAAQARDLDQMLGYQIGAPGANGASVREEDLRRSDMFTLPWVDEAITVYEQQRRM
ncbi:hypothetical protein CcaverHIS002_0408030 [Cutaneotrichosporon cavernicola]|uniref:DM2 domain-containing protein n=1 Tax=Cutaneotrichosporon cavernicola TaxID=279322 RepID=A0AA48QW48_9TREE|nr:uncharacterized protein CcaverHIS019_0408010 [Cutaneotrichosporon cavernicola]BEI84199.1 hypothetical protein CcaverHIS002_0408030 [Cutaneotrichosporon cavernicola]BEI91981.1 hypothetical protein CcaverHIS019_0408010 [Cutaneotrichosporon cavernicola]BEI99752.1 hypothetical protein CcaverHIS631_0407950 [Cutaneotrichosporon cavernicola]BEJ07528.1 hypothetical protein CcaverHIS641_0407970 [Cutaneotrichosporon cavernicola]